MREAKRWGFLTVVFLVMVFAALQLSEQPAEALGACCHNSGVCSDGYACCPACDKIIGCPNYYGVCMEADSVCCAAIE
jgi:hypothetical protein